MDWFLYDRDVYDERVKPLFISSKTSNIDVSQGPVYTSTESTCSATKNSD